MPINIRIVSFAIVQSAAPQSPSVRLVRPRQVRANSAFGDGRINKLQPVAQQQLLTADEVLPHKSIDIERCACCFT